MYVIVVNIIYVVAAQYVAIYVYSFVLQCPTLFIIIQCSLYNSGLWPQQGAGFFSTKIVDLLHFKQNT